MKSAHPEAGIRGYRETLQKSQRLIALQNNPGELKELIQVLRDDVHQNRQQQVLVVMHGNIAKRHHALKFIS